MVFKTALFLLLNSNLLAYPHYKIAAMYFDELAFIIDVEGVDIKTRVKNCKPKKDKLTTIQWLIRNKLRSKKLTVSNLEASDRTISAVFYFNNIELSKILSKNKLCK